MVLPASPPFIEPCLPSPGEQPPTGPDWVHEIKHDGYRLMARRDSVSVGIRLLTRNGHDWASRYPLIVQAVNKLKVRNCLIDGEAVCCNEHGVPSFEKLRHRSNDQDVVLIAFDLLELDGEDLRREPFEVRKQTLASLLRGSLPGVQFNAHLMHRGDIVFAHACKMGLEGIVSKRLGSRYRSGRTNDWLKFKNPEAPAVKREAEQDWGKMTGMDKTEEAKADLAEILERRPDLKGKSIEAVRRILRREARLSLRPLRTSKARE